MSKCLPFIAFIVSVLFYGLSAKECTNVPIQISTHTARYELQYLKNETLKREIISHYHLTPTDDSTWLSLLPSLLPRKMLEEDEVNWAMMYRKMKLHPGGFNAPGNLLKEVSLHDVRLDSSSVHGRAQQTNLEYLLMLDVDNLVWSFRKNAGLHTPGKPYGGWEKPDCELRGHFVGHYLSASAKSWASTHNTTLKEKMTAVVSALSACQKKIGTGYLSAFPSEEFDRFEALQYVWAPYYTIHKIMAGLLDQYMFADNAQALKMVTLMADYFYRRVRNVIAEYTIERQWQSINEETGGMNDILYKLFTITKDPKHFWLAQLFDKPSFLGPLALKDDTLSGLHVNTHIPILVGSQKHYEITGDPLYKDIATFFLSTVNSSHSFATGGTSSHEHWSDPNRLADVLTTTENEESCTTYNMLKVSRHLFRWTKKAAYGDYYERALTNGVLSIQRGTDPGVMIYMLPLGHVVSKARSYWGWGTKFDSLWCCYGTGIESFSKLGDSIYFEEEGKVPGLYVIQYVSSSLNWESGNILLTQKVDPVASWVPYLRATFTFSSKKGASQSSTLNLRIPIWTHSKGVNAAVNGQRLSVPAPGTFLSVTRNWRPGDKITMELPITLRMEAIEDDRPEYASLHAILYGPYLLAGFTSEDWDWNLNTTSSNSLSDWITPVQSSSNSHLVTFSQVMGKSNFVISTSKDSSITVENRPSPGTDEALRATFKLNTFGQSSSNISSAQDLVGATVMLEPFHLPGMVVKHLAGEHFEIKEYNGDPWSTGYQLVHGLDGKSGTVSLEAKSQAGCYIHSGTKYTAGTLLKLKCSNDSNDENFKRAASFRMEKGIRNYHPISFVAKGATRNFLLEPLMSFRDETYNVYFNVQAS